MSLTTALTRALTRAVCPGTRAGFSTSRTASRAASPVVKPKDGVRQVAEMTPEQIEELSVFQAAGGLTTAAFGGIVVFVIGAGATLGVAAGISQVLGASPNPVLNARHGPRPAPLSRAQFIPRRFPNNPLLHSAPLFRRSHDEFEGAGAPTAPDAR